MIDLLVWTFWFIFGAYSFWFFTKAKTLQPLTLDDLALTWRIHKMQTGCTASRIDSLIVKGDHVVGFECDCGHEFLQKRLISARVPADLQAGMVSSTFSEDGDLLVKTGGSSKKSGVRFSRVKRI